MNQYLVVFGRTPILSFYELAAYFPDVEKISDRVALINNPDIEKIFAKLGGATKVAILKGLIDTVSETDLIPYIPVVDNACNFGMSIIDLNNIELIPILAKIKKNLKNSGVSVRYVMPKENNELSSPQVDLNDITEIILFPYQGKIGVAQTILIQDFREWSKRDYERPFADPASGMLPPKVARMIINIVLGVNYSTKTILDPFCGMGTILSEAMCLGVKSVFGADISREIVTKADQNLKWIVKQYQTNCPHATYVSDAVHISDHIPESAIDAIITEPFMGSRMLGLGGVSQEKVQNIIKGLEKLYIGCMKDWKKILKPDGLVCIAFPSVRVGAKNVYVKKVIDTCENLGYTKVLGPIRYGRPDAIVQRNFYLFNKN